MHRLLRRAALAALAAVFLVPAAPSQAAVKGLNIAGLDDVDTAIAQGAKQVRFFALWDHLEPNGPADFTKDGPAAQNDVFAAYQNAIAKTLAAGATPLVVVVDSPAWASFNGAAGRFRPAATATFAQFFGEFVAANRKLRAEGQTIVYEVWNEEDGKEFWGEGPNPTFYANMLKESYAAGKAADPGATILVGPTTGNNYQWINALYDNGAQGSFDGVAVHTDTACLDRGPDKFYRDPHPSGDPRQQGPLGQFTFLGYRTIREVMLARGDDKPIWMTELGWSSTNGGPTSCARGDNAGKKPSGVTRQQQADFMKQAYGCLALDPYVVSGAWFTLRDTNTSTVDELNNYGLFAVDGSPKPSLNVFRTVDPAVSGPCGDFQKPGVSVEQVGFNGQFTSALKVRVTAVDNAGGVGIGGENSRITFEVANNPALRVNFTAKSKTPLKADGKVEYTFTGTKNLPLGDHVLRVYALDNNQNQEVRDIPIKKVSRIAQTITPSVTPKKPKCKGRTCTLSGNVTAAGGVNEGKVRIEWLWKTAKRGYKVLHKSTKNANKPFSVKQKLAKKGKWRVRVKFLGGGAVKPRTSKTFNFTVR